MKKTYIIPSTETSLVEAKHIFCASPAASELGMGGPADPGAGRAPGRVVGVKAF